MIGHLTRRVRGDGSASFAADDSPVVANAGWLAAALLYGYVMSVLLAPGRYSGGPVLAAICAAGFVLLLLGTARRIRRSAYYEAAAGCLMVGYSLDSLYHREEILLSLFLVLAVGLFVSGLARST